MQGEAASGSEGTAGDSGTAQAVQLESFGPARQTDGAYTIKAYDASVIRQPACGQVDLSYFSDAAFLGDSLTVGFSDYQINLSGALICGYTGVGPDAIVNRAAVKSPTRGQEIALDVLAAAQPKKLYILLGTNTLTTLGALETSPLVLQVMPAPVRPSTLKAESVKAAIILSQMSLWSMSAVMPAFWQAS